MIDDLQNVFPKEIRMSIYNYNTELLCRHLVVYAEPQKKLEHDGPVWFGVSRADVLCWKLTKIMKIDSLELGIVVSFYMYNLYYFWFSKLANKLI